MTERRHRKINPFNQPSPHGANLRSGQPIPRRSTPWEKSGAQSFSDKHAMIRHLTLEHIANKYPVFGNRGLPAYSKKAEIIHTVEHNKASSTDGATGSGKSTQEAQFLYEAGYRVYHIVPRKNIADGLADRLVEEMSSHIDNADEIVGITHGDYSHTHENNMITVMTANTFLMMEKDIREQYGDEKVVIICDETHESNLYVDVAMGVAAQAVSQQDKWRVHAVSATQNQAAVNRAFADLAKGDVPNVHIEGRPFDMEIHERPNQSVYDIYAEVGHDHDMAMIFSSGKGEIDHIIKETKHALDNKTPGSSLDVDFRVLHGDLSRTERWHVKNDPIPDGKRVVIVSTNAGTSGITIPGNTLVITDGTVNRSELDNEAVGGLVRRYLSQDGLMQQFGRAGRDVSGGVGYMAAPTVIHEDQLRARGAEYEESMPYIPFNQRETFGKPEIYDSLLGQVALTVAALDRSFYAINKFLPNPVEGSGIISAQDSLYRMGAMRPLDDDDDNLSQEDLYTITPTGRSMSRFPMRPELSRGLVEATKPGKSIKHMARVAYMAAALEAGGLQDFEKDADTEWETLLRPTTKNDWIAQLDIMQALPNLGRKEVDEAFVERYNLNFRRVERAMNVTRKIFRELDITHPETLRDFPSNQTEEQQAITDLMAGMGDNIYERVGRKYKRTMYRNIHGNPESTQRFVSDRSVTQQNEHKLIAGWPRYFIQARSGEKKDIIELISPVEATDIARYARQHDTYERQPSGNIQINGGLVQQTYIPKFGSLQIGSPEVGSPDTIVSAEVQKAVAEYVFNHPGPAQTELRRVASVLEYLQKSVPKETLEIHKNPDSGDYLTNDDINSTIMRLAKNHTALHKIDQELSAFLRQGSYHVGRYFNDPSYKHLMQIAPSHLVLQDGSSAQVHYATPTTPYVTLAPDGSNRAALHNSDLTLPDGRTVFIKTYDSEEHVIFLEPSQL